MMDSKNEARRSEVSDLLSKLVKLDTEAEKAQKFVEEFVKYSLPVDLMGPNNRLIVPHTYLNIAYKRGREALYHEKVRDDLI